VIFTRPQQKVKKAGSVPINVTFRHGRLTIVAVRKQYVFGILGMCYSIDYPTCKGMHCIIFSPVLCPPVPYLSTLSHKGHDF